MVDYVHVIDFRIIIIIIIIITLLLSHFNLELIPINTLHFHSS